MLRERTKGNREEKRKKQEEEWNHTSYRSLFCWVVITTGSVRHITEKSRYLQLRIYLRIEVFRLFLDRMSKKNFFLFSCLVFFFFFLYQSSVELDWDCIQHKLLLSDIVAFLLQWPSVLESWPLEILKNESIFLNYVTYNEEVQARTCWNLTKINIKWYIP